jgi:prophage regulatory protein
MSRRPNPYLELAAELGLYLCSLLVRCVKAAGTLGVLVAFSWLTGGVYCHRESLVIFGVAHWVLELLAYTTSELKTLAEARTGRGPRLRTPHRRRGEIKEGIARNRKEGKVAVPRKQERKDKSLRRFLSMRQVEETTGLSRATIYRKMAKGTFPLSVRISEGRVGWERSAVDAWCRQMLRRRPS